MLRFCVFFPPHSLHDLATTVLSGFRVFSLFRSLHTPPRFLVDDFEHLVEGFAGLVALGSAGCPLGVPWVSVLGSAAGSVF